MDPIDIATSDLRPGQKIVLQLLQRMGWCVSMDKLAKEASLTTLTVCRAIGSLVEMGVLECVEKGGPNGTGPRPSKYAFHPEKMPGKITNPMCA